MRFAIYIEDKMQQVVLTPEDEGEKRLLELMTEKQVVEIKRGSFAECRGGWMRQYDGVSSVMLVLRRPAPMPVEEAPDGTAE